MVYIISPPKHKWPHMKLGKPVKVGNLVNFGKLGKHGEKPNFKMQKLGLNSVRSRSYWFSFSRLDELYPMGVIPSVSW